MKKPSLQSPSSFFELSNLWASFSKNEHKHWVHSMESRTWKLFRKIRNLFKSKNLKTISALQLDVFECFRHDYAVRYVEKNSFFFFFMKNHISEINVFAEFHFVCVKKHHFLNKKVQLLCKKAQRKRHFLEFEWLFLCIYFEMPAQKWNASLNLFQACHVKTALF